MFIFEILSAENMFNYYLHLFFYRFIYHNLVLMLSLSYIDFITLQLLFEPLKSQFSVLNSNDWMFLSEIISLR